MQLMRAKKNSKTSEKKSMDKKEVLSEIKRLADANCIPIIYFASHDDLKLFMEDTIRGANVRYNFKTYDIPLEKELLQ